MLVIRLICVVMILLDSLKGKIMCGGIFANKPFLKGLLVLILGIVLLLICSLI